MGSSSTRGSRQLSVSRRWRVTRRNSHSEYGHPSRAHSSKSRKRSSSSRSRREGRAASTTHSHMTALIFAFASLALSYRARIYCIGLQPHIELWPCIGFRPRIYCIGSQPRIGLRPPHLLHRARFWVLAPHRASAPLLGFGPSSGFGPTFELRPRIGLRSCIYCFRAPAQHLLLLGTSPAFITFSGFNCVHPPRSTRCKEQQEEIGDITPGAYHRPLQQMRTAAFPFNIRARQPRFLIPHGAI
ncbi:hypothetical protein CRG98_014195 [Punica granatum]|uniref:Uncharacterized protein n=1 Tax=Punica granatum TaxID=22663 RepID=A0A2I0KCG6_PUNGR|nr:hypothetical protein CRG98_014195 [Punica granatum]